MWPWSGSFMAAVSTPATSPFRRRNGIEAGVAGRPFTRPGGLCFQSVVRMGNRRAGRKQRRPSWMIPTRAAVHRSAYNLTPYRPGGVRRRRAT